MCWKNTGMWKTLEPCANFLSVFCKFYVDHGKLEEFVNLANMKIWKKEKTFRAGFAMLLVHDPPMFNTLYKNMFNPDPKKRCSAAQVKAYADKHLKGDKSKAKSLLNSLINKLDLTKERTYQKKALEMARKEFYRDHMKITQTKKKSLYNCRYCKAKFNYKPLWCKCGRPSYISDGPTFLKAS